MPISYKEKKHLIRMYRRRLKKLIASIFFVIGILKRRNIRVYNVDETCSARYKALFTNVQRYPDFSVGMLASCQRCSRRIAFPSSAQIRTGSYVTCAAARQGQQSVCIIPCRPTDRFKDDMLIAQRVTTNRNYWAIPVVVYRTVLAGPIPKERIDRAFLPEEALEIFDVDIEPIILNKQPERDEGVPLDEEEIDYEDDDEI